MTSTDTDWRAIEPIKVIEEKIILPKAPAEPGLYRLSFNNDKWYFGEAGDINRRLGDYHTPGQGVEAELRIHKQLKEHGGASVDVMTGPEFATRSQRCIREHLEIKNARLAGKNLLNGGNIQEQIAFHKAEIARLQKKLDAQSGLKQEEDHDA